MNILPKPIPKVNATIGLLCPAGGLGKDRIHKLDIVQRYLQLVGFKTKVGKAIESVKFPTYLSSDRKSRVDDFNSFLDDSDVSAIFCLRGGSGSVHLVEDNGIDFEKVKLSRKPLVGFSDITTLQLAYLKKSQMISFHGPMLAVGNYLDENAMPSAEHKDSLVNMWKILQSESYKFSYDFKADNSQSLFLGSAEGKLVGGNLTVLCASLGTKYEPNFTSSILFIEDVNEPLYRIERNLNHLNSCNVFNKINGLIIGDLTGCEYEDKKEIDIDTLREFLIYFFNSIEKKMPVIYNVPFGHKNMKYTFPVGLDVKLDSEKLNLSSVNR